MAIDTNADGECIVARLKKSSVGVPVWRIMSPDGKGYLDEFSRDGCVFPDVEARDYLFKQQEKGRMIGCYVLEATRKDHRDRLIQEAVLEIERLQKRVRQLESHLQDTIDMKTK